MCRCNSRRAWSYKHLETLGNVISRSWCRGFCWKLQELCVQKHQFWIIQFSQLRYALRNKNIFFYITLRSWTVFSSPDMLKLLSEVVLRMAQFWEKWWSMCLALHILRSFSEDFTAIYLRLSTNWASPNKGMSMDLGKLKQLALKLWWIFKCLFVRTWLSN